VHLVEDGSLLGLQLNLFPVFLSLTEILINALVERSVLEVVLGFVLLQQECRHEVLHDLAFKLFYDLELKRIR